PSSVSSLYSAYAANKEVLPFLRGSTSTMVFQRYASPSLASASSITSRWKGSSTRGVAGPAVDALDEVLLAPIGERQTFERRGNRNPLSTLASLCTRGCPAG